MNVDHISRGKLADIFIIGFLLSTPNSYLVNDCHMFQVAKALASEKQIRFAPFADGRLTEVGKCGFPVVLFAFVSLIPGYIRRVKRGDWKQSGRKWTHMGTNGSKYTVGTKEIDKHQQAYTETSGSAWKQVDKYGFGYPQALSDGCS